MLIIHCKLIAGYFFVVYYFSRPFVWTTRDLTKRVHIVPSRHSFRPGLIVDLIQTLCSTSGPAWLWLDTTDSVHSRSRDRTQWKYDTDRWDRRSVMMLDAYTSVHVILKYLPPGCGRLLATSTKHTVCHDRHTKNCYNICSYINLFFNSNIFLLYNRLRPFYT